MQQHLINLARQEAWDACVQIVEEANMEVGALQATRHQNAVKHGQQVAHDGGHCNSDNNGCNVDVKALQAMDVRDAQATR